MTFLKHWESYQDQSFQGAITRTMKICFQEIIQRCNLPKLWFNFFWQGRLFDSQKQKFEITCNEVEHNEECRY